MGRFHKQKHGHWYFDGIPAGPNWKELFAGKLLTMAKSFARPLRIALPCCGVDGCTEALENLGIPFLPVNVYDLEDKYQETLRTHYRTAGVPEDKINMHLGKEAGHRGTY